MTRISRRAALAAAGTFVLPRVAIAQADQRPTITVAVQKIANSNTLDIAREGSNVGTRHYNLYAEPLIDTDWTGDLATRPGLAESWRVIDERIVELTLRSGVRFHNGDALTAEDVAYSLGERLFGEGGGARAIPLEMRAAGRTLFPALERVEIVDRRTVRVVNRVPDVTLLGRLTHRIGVITARRAFAEAESWLASVRKPVGTGPYQVREFRPDNLLVLDAFDDYWGGRPPIRSLRFVEIPEVSARINGLHAGEFDFACDIPPDQIAVVERNPRVEVVGGIILNTRVLNLDKTNAQLADPRVRRAFAHAVDRQAIVDHLWAGRTRIPKGLQFEFFGEMYDPTWSTPGYDLAEARRLLREAGYRGDPIPFRVLNNYYTAQVPTAQVLVEMWRTAGLNVAIEMKENWTQVEAREGRGLNDNSHSAFFNDPVSSFPGVFGQNGGLQRNGYWRNDEADTLLTVLETSIDRPRRRTAYRRLLEIIERDDPANVVLHQTANFAGKSKAISWRPAQSFVMDFRARNFAMAPR
jgi:peptide/nickel transport system substrate-binding protein